MTQPNPQNPPPLDYRSPGSPPPGSTGTLVLRFFAGLFLGAAVSAIIWIGGWKMVERSTTGAPIFLVPAIKLFTGSIFLFIRGWRSFGAGILVSIGIGALIMFGSCAAHMSTH